MQYSVDSLDDLKQTFADIRMRTVQIAREALQEERRKQGSAFKEQPVVIVDGKRGRSMESVKDFGTIIIVARSGPVLEAVQMAHQYVIAQTATFKNASGFYANRFLWLMNGERVGDQPPDVRRMGLRGNVQLVNRAGYASTLEIALPDHIVRGAYELLRRRFGARLKLSFGYGPADAFAQEWPSDRGEASTHPLAVPVLTIGHPAATFTERQTRPGVRRRRRERVAFKEAARLVRRLT